ncbi:protein FAM227B-like [Polymixia lowei]
MANMKAIDEEEDVIDNYPGFTEVENTDIPGLPNPFQHLHSVSEAQNAWFLKIWKPFFVSCLPVATLKDTFWWFFLQVCMSHMEDEENRLFDRIAGVFVSLVMTAQVDVKDRRFKVYADCLAQAVYTSFYGAFPDSKERLGDDFKRDLADRS